MKRRQLLGAMGLGAVGLGPFGLGCRRGATTLATVDPDIGRKNRPETIAAMIPIKAGRAVELRERLEEHVFEIAAPGVHYARLLIVPEETHLLLSAVFDDTVEALLQLMEFNAARVDYLFALTEGYPAAGAAAPFELRGWLKRNEVPTTLLYSAYDRASEPAVREVVQLRTEFVSLVQAVQRRPHEADSAYTRFLAANRRRIDTHRDNVVDQLTPAQLTVPSDQNPFTMIFDLQPSWIKRLEKTLKDGEWLLDHLHIHPLKKIPTVHYARFANITPTKVLFESVYDGDWLQYVSDFAVNIPTQLDLVWGGAVGYPKGGAKDAAALGEFLQRKKVPRDYFYMAYTGDTVKEIQASLALGRKLVTFSKEAPQDASRLARHIERFVHRNQTLMA